MAGPTTTSGIRTRPRPRPQVHGLSVTPTTQCAHYSSPLDIIAIKHYCCRTYYACIKCHEALTSSAHAAQVWPPRHRHHCHLQTTSSEPGSTAPSRSDESGRTGDKVLEDDNDDDDDEDDDDADRVVMCGKCGREMSIAGYLGSGNRCRTEDGGCGAAFNPGCARHYTLYFDMNERPV